MIFRFVLLCFSKVCNGMRVRFVFLKIMIRLNRIDAEFRELFEQLSSETDIEEYINFDIEVVTSATDVLIV